MEANLIPSQQSSSKKVIFAIIAIFGLVALIAGTFTINQASIAQSSLLTRESIHPSIAKDLFEHWKLRFAVTYETPEIEAAKFETFITNYVWTMNWNADPTSTSSVGLNQFSDLTTAEFSKKISCLIGTPEISADAEFNLPEETDNELPSSVDWRQKGAVTGIKNQGQCGSCWAFSTTGSLEGFNFIKNGNLTSFSEQQLVDCSQAYGNQGCDGGWMFWAMNYTGHKGIEKESTYPYKGVDQKCKYNSANVAFQNTMYTNVTASSQVALQTAAAAQPVSVAIEADQPVFQSYTGGIITSKSCGTQIDHGVLVVGYNSAQKYYIVKNSWGESWGEKGYVRIGMNGNGKGICGIQQFDSVPN